MQKLKLDRRREKLLKDKAIAEAHGIEVPTRFTARMPRRR